MVAAVSNSFYSVKMAPLKPQLATSQPYQASPLFAQILDLMSQASTDQLPRSHRTQLPPLASCHLASASLAAQVAVLH